MTTYRDAGVDIDAGDEFVDRIKPLVRATFRALQSDPISVRIDFTD